MRDNELLKKIATAMVENPRYTLKELAEASGISKATLHRLCGTRENLENILAEKGEETLAFIIETAEKEYNNYSLGLEELVKSHYKEHEFLQILFSVHTSCSQERYIPYLTAMDNFFLRGQKQGEFRIDISASFLTSVFTSTIYGLVNAEHSGRIAKSNLEVSFKNFLLDGIRNKD